MSKSFGLTALVLCNKKEKRLKNITKGNKKKVM